MNIILFGMKAVGKTTVGALLASKLQMNFYDSDRLMEAQYEKQYSHALGFQDLYLTLGEAAFRALERKVILNWQAEKAVLSVGGEQFA